MLLSSKVQSNTHTHQRETIPLSYFLSSYVPALRKLWARTSLVSQFLYAAAKARHLITCPLRSAARGTARSPGSRTAAAVMIINTNTAESEEHIRIHQRHALPYTHSYICSREGEIICLIGYRIYRCSDEVTQHKKTMETRSWRESPVSRRDGAHVVIDHILEGIYDVG